jgi:hypothetical protein
MHKQEPLVPASAGEARSLIHDALEFLYSRGGDPLEPLDFKAAFGATDTLLDIEEAFHAFENKEWSLDLGTSYLLTIGTLQALVIQQDATRVLCKVFDLAFNPNNNEALRHIREMRVRVAGHPSRHGEWKKEPGSTFLVRQAFTKESAKVVTYFDDLGKIERNEINLVALYSLQQKLIRDLCASFGQKFSITIPKLRSFAGNRGL